MSADVVLVIHPGALGDVLQAVPALRALSAAGPRAFAGQPRLGALLNGLGVVETALAFDSFGLDALFVPGSPSRALVERLARYRRVISWFGARDSLYPRQLRAVVSDSIVAPALPEPDSTRTVWQHLLATMGVTSRPDVSPIDLPESWRDDARRTLDTLGVEPARPLLVVHPGAGGEWKLWPSAHLAAVVEAVTRRTGAQALIHQGPADAAAVERLLASVAVPATRLVEPTLPRLAGILSLGDAYLGGDSGISHLAAAVGTRAIILFPTRTLGQWTPWSPTACALAMENDAGAPERVTGAVLEAIGHATRP